VVCVLSDRTRHRLGRRGPWTLAGALMGSAAMLVLAVSASLPSLLIGYVLVQAG
jgi:Na+/melibiose symporter-like transporter